MRLLMISTDRKILVPNSPVEQRMIEYGKLFGELHIIVFSLNTQAWVEKQIAPNTFIYPTRSSNRFLYILDAIKIGKRILSGVYFGPTSLTSQDPFETGVVGAALKRGSGNPLQVQLHTDAWSSYFFYASFLNWIRVILLAPLVLRRADGVRVVSEKIKRDVIINCKLPAKKIFVLPIFVDVLPYANSPVIIDLHRKYPKWETIVLVASRLTPEKNVMLALKVFAKAIKNHPKVGLVVVGEGSELLRLEHFAHRKARNNVVFEGWQNELASYFRTADIFLNTSQYEGYGMSLIEAGASGCPVITTKVGVGHDFLEDDKNAQVCPVGDEKCLYRKLVTLLENGHLRKTLGMELQKQVMEQAISKEEYLREYRSHFDSLVPAK